MSLGADAITFLAKLAPEALPAVGRLFSAILAGDAAKAQREARVAAETIAAKQAVRAAAKAASKALRK
ncbi:hypothetical protein [Caudoviricetes sp.]|nr:hypothetical protein [Caudoviricetes sp.]